MRTPEEVLEHCDAWDEMYKRLGMYGMAKKIMKMKSYRDYVQKWPYDFTTKVESLDDIDTEYNGVSIEEEVSIRMELDELEKELTPRQKEVYEGLKSGMDNSEIESAFGFNTNNFVDIY